MPFPDIRFQVSGFRYKPVVYFLAILLLTTYYLLNTSNALAETTGGVVAGYSNYGPPQQTGYTLQNIANNLAGCWAIGVSLIPGGTSAAGCPAYDVAGNVVIYSKVPGGGAIGGVSKIMVAMYNNPPVSSKEYLADLGKQMGIVQPAYAQSLPTFGVGGSGDKVLVPILNLWKVMRNLAYLIFIVIFIVVGFMIMFRTKINPQTVISVQSALPSLVIGLFLVTFSYFIAALIIDFSYVAMGLVGFIFIQSGLSNILAPTATGTGIDATAINNLSTNSNIFGLGLTFINNDLLKGNLIPYFTNLFDATSLIAGNQTDAAQTQNLFQNLITGNFAAALGQATQVLASVALFGAGILVSAIIILAVLIQVLRLLWQMVTAYITVLIFSIGGPLLITVGSIPGRGGVISYWWKTLLANVLIFPAIFGVILFAGMFLANVGAFTTALPLFNGLPTNILSAIIGYGIILGSPAVPGLVKQALGVKDISAFQQAAFQGVGSGGAVYGAGFKGLTKPISTQRQAYKEAYYRNRFAQAGTYDEEGNRRQIGPWWVRRWNK